MEQATAQFWLDTGVAVAGALWLSGAWFVASTRRLCAEPLRGDLDVASDPATVMARLTKVLADARPGSPLQSSSIEAATQREIRWSSIGLFRHRGSVRTSGEPRRTRVEWEVQGQPGGLLLGARVVVALGALVTIGLYLVLREFVLPSESPGVRGQVFQMVQAVHVLWPPFLLAGFARRSRRLVGEEVRRAVQNAPFV